MSDYDSVVILNEGYELRTSKSGKTRCTIKVTAESLVHNLDPKTLGQGPAQAIAKYFRDRIEGITDIAPPNTLRARKTALAAFVRGAAWATKRYGGGRTGSMPPDQSDRAFNDSERMAKTITANAAKDGNSWRVNVAANRLTDQNSGGVARIWAKLTALVPEIGDSSLLADALPVQKAIRDTQRAMITKAKASSSKLGLEVAKLLIDAFKSVDELMAG